EIFERLMSAVAHVQRRMPVIFPVHPRVRKAIDARGALPNLVCTDPLGYLDFMRLVSQSRFVLTDSGGVQEETTGFGRPCLTMRENTERPVTISVGTNRLVGLDPEQILSAVSRVLSTPRRAHTVPEMWDGRASERILNVLTNRSEKIEGVSRHGTYLTSLV